MHMAAFGVIWARILYENPAVPRTKYVNKQIESIEATATLYINSPSYVKYWDILKYNTAQALMTESTTFLDNNKKPLRCDTLINPCSSYI